MEGNTQTQAMNDDLAGPANLLHTKAFTILRKIITAPFGFVRGLFDFGMKDPDLVIYRQDFTNAALYFIHGLPEMPYQPGEIFRSLFSPTPISTTMTFSPGVTRAS